MTDDCALRRGAAWDWAWCCLGLRSGASGDRARAQCRAAQGRSGGVRRDARWDCAGVQCGAVQGRNVGGHKGAVQGCVRVKHGFVHGGSVGQCRGAVRGCAGAQCGAVHEHSAGVAQGRNAKLRKGTVGRCVGEQYYYSPWERPPPPHWPRVVFPSSVVVSTPPHFTAMTPARANHRVPTVCGHTV